MGFKQVNVTEVEKGEVTYGELGNGELFVTQDDLDRLDGELKFDFVRIVGDEEDGDGDRWSTYLPSGTMYALEESTPVVRVEVEILGVKRG